MHPQMTQIHADSEIIDKSVCLLFLIPNLLAICGLLAA